MRSEGVFNVFFVALLLFLRHIYNKMTIYKILPALACILVFASPVAFSQQVQLHAFIESKHASLANDTIYYDFDRSLSWGDFKGKPDNDHFRGAVTASGFAFDSQANYDGKTLSLDIGVYAFFSKSDSWKKPEINSDYHLLHEQHHFDITRLGAQNFIEDLQKAHFTKDNYEKVITSIFDKDYQANEDMQLQYDRETNHSLVVERQLQWNTRIAGAIQKLKETTVEK
jgi:hypothetical protein